MEGERRYSRNDAREASEKKVTNGAARSLHAVFTGPFNSLDSALIAEAQIVTRFTLYSRTSSTTYCTILYCTD
jgi:hypothetical protein